MAVAPVKEVPTELKPETKGLLDKILEDAKVTPDEFAAFCSHIKGDGEVDKIEERAATMLYKKALGQTATIGEKADLTLEYSQTVPAKTFQKTLLCISFVFLAVYVMQFLFSLK
jgi:hypothetical protein